MPKGAGASIQPKTRKHGPCQGRLAVPKVEGYPSTVRNGKAIARPDSGVVRLVTQGETLALEINLAAVPDPADSYFADYLDVFVRDRMCTFDFGKRNSGNTALRSRLEVMVSMNFLPDIAKSIRPAFLDKIRAHAKANDFRPGAPPPSTEAPDSKQHTMAANFALLAYSDADASIAFYRLPPTVHIWIAKKDLDRIHIEPVVRVDTTTSILLSFCEAVDRLSAEAVETKAKETSP